MPLEQQIYLIGTIAAFVVFGLVIAFCRFDSPRRPSP